MEIDAEIVISTPSGAMKVTGEGSRLCLSLPSGAFMVSAIFRSPLPRRKTLTRLASVLSQGGLSLDILIGSQRVARLGAEASRFSLPRLLGIRDLHVYTAGLIRSAFHG